MIDDEAWLDEIPDVYDLEPPDLTCYLTGKTSRFAIIPDSDMVRSVGVYDLSRLDDVGLPYKPDVGMTPSAARRLVEQLEADDPRLQDGYEPPEPHFDEPTRTLHGPR